jgi:putative membrane protein insertion efficiency factor
MKTAVLWMLKIYRVLLSPFVPTTCRFYPTCSSYMIEAIEKKGLLKGMGLGFVRLLKCHPFHPGGFDPVK